MQKDTKLQLAHSQLYDVYSASENPRASQPTNRRSNRMLISALVIISLIGFSAYYVTANRTPA